LYLVKYVKFDQIWPLNSEFKIRKIEIQINSNKFVRDSIFNLLFSADINLLQFLRLGFSPSRKIKKERCLIKLTSQNLRFWMKVYPKIQLRPKWKWCKHNNLPIVSQSTNISLISQNYGATFGSFFQISLKFCEYIR